MQGGSGIVLRKKIQDVVRGYVLGPGREGGVEKVHGSLAKPAEANL